MYSEGKEANWLAPKGGSQQAQGVVLFMHGFAQGPNAYYENLQGIADAGFLVVAPVPPFAATPGRQQTLMVQYAAHFHSKLVSNTLTGLPLPSTAVAQRIGLLGHSVGAGLATHVAQQAAEAAQPFKAVMYMAPQTQVVSEFKPATAISKWPTKKSTKFALQYGLKDDLAPPDLSLALITQLNDGGLGIKDENITSFPDGTHVGFEDQVVLGDAEVTSDILPILNPLLLWLINSLSALGVPFLPLLLGRILKSKLADGTPRGSLGAEKDEEEGEEVAGYMAGPLSRLRINPQDIALLEQQTGRREREQKLQARPPPADGLGPPEEVSIASAEASIAQYVGLLTATVLAFVALASRTLEGFSEGHTPWLPLIGTLVTGYFTYEGWYYLQLQNYVNNVQRPQSRAKAREFMMKQLL